MGLDGSDISIYRPVFNLSFMSKVIEQCSTAQLNEYLLTNDLMPRLQSAYRKQHSTETALLRVWSDTLNAADTQVTRLATCTCLQHSTALITISCCSGWNMALVCRTLCCYGSIRSCPTEHSKWPMEANCRHLNRCCSAKRRALF